jgi:hypothetical protein
MRVLWEAHPGPLHWERRKARPNEWEERTLAMVRWSVLKYASNNVVVGVLLIGKEEQRE